MTLIKAVRGLIASTLVLSALFTGLSPSMVAAAPSWPTTWISLGTDQAENGGQNYRDVLESYYQVDSQYLFLRLRTIDPPHLLDSKGKADARYKWFFDTNHDFNVKGGTAYNWDYLLYLEDTNVDGVGDLYLATPSNLPGTHITDTNIGGYLLNSGGNYVDFYIRLDQVGGPTTTWVMWATDQANPNYAQAPNLDTPDSLTTFLLVTKGSILVNKTVAGTPPSNSWQFSYTGPGGTSGSFSIAAAGGSDNISSLAFGSYTFTETTKVCYTCSPSNIINVVLSASNPNSTITFTNTNSTPIANFTAIPTSGCAPLTVQFTDNSTGATSWAWDFDNNGTIDSTSQNPSNQYNSPGIYTVKLTATNSCGSDNITKPGLITVNPTPIANFTAIPTSGCAPLIVQFTDNSTGSPTSWAWDFDNNGTTDSTAQNPSYQYNSPGIYTVKLTSTNSCGSNTFTRNNYITANPSPIADFSAVPLSGFAPLTVNFTDNSTGSPTSWAWDFDNNGTTDSIQQNPIYQYLTAGIYSVKLSVTNAFGCSDNKTRTDYIIVSMAPTPPTITDVEIYTDQAYNNPATSMTPQTPYFAKVSITSNNNLSYLQTVQVTLFYNDGSHPDAPTSGNTQTCAIFTCAVGPPANWTYDFGSPPSPTTTWQLVSLQCSQPANLNVPTGYWIFAFRPGKVATESITPAHWDVQGKAINKSSQSGDLYRRDKAMNWYGEITINSPPPDWGEVPLGLKFQDAPNPKTVSTNYIANGDYYEDIMSSDNWTGSGQTVMLDISGSDPAPAGTFALKADNTLNYGDSHVVGSTQYLHINAGGTLTTEAGVPVDTNGLWLSIGEADINPATYSGAIYYQIADR
jgi:PKD repeat protein